MVKRKADIGRQARKSKRRRLSQQVGLRCDNNLDLDLGLAPQRQELEIENRNVDLEQYVRLEVQRHKLSAMDKSCNFCQARLFKEESKG